VRRSPFGEGLSRVPGEGGHPAARRPTLAGVLLALLALLAPLPVSSAPAPEAALVEVVEPTPRRVEENLPFTGTVTSERSASLSPRVSGLVAAVHVDAGDRVEEGQVLLELDDELARLSLERTRAALDEAESRLGETERLREEALTLLNRRTIAKTEADARQAETRVASAAARRLGVLVREEEERLARHRLLAPFSGVISRRDADPGEWVETGTAVLDLVEVERVRLDVQVPQERIEDITLDTPVSVRLDSAPDLEFTGRVRAKVPVTEPGARTFLVRVGVDERPDAMMPGVSGHAVFRLRNREPVVVVPRDAVVRSADGTNTIWVVENHRSEPRAASRSVRLGRTFADVVEVREGLPDDAPVVVRGNEGLQDGRPVRMIESRGEAGAVPPTKEDLES